MPGLFRRIGGRFKQHFGLVETDNKTIRNFSLAEALNNIPSALFWPFSYIYYLKMGANITQIGLLATLDNILSSFVGMASGFLMSKRSRTRVISVSKLLVFLAFLFLPLSANFIQVAILVILISIISNISSIAYSTLIADAVSSNEIGVFYALLSTIGSLTTIFLRPVAGIIIDNWGFTYVLSLSSLSTLALSIIFVKLQFSSRTRNDRSCVRSEKNNVFPKRRVWQRFRSMMKTMASCSNFFLLQIASLTINLGIATPSILYSIFIINDLGGNMSELGTVYTIMPMLNLILTFTMPYFGLVSQKVGKKRALILSYFIFSMYFIYVSSVRTVLGFALGYILLMIAIPFNNIAYYPFLIEVIPSEDKSAYIGINSGLAPLPSMLGPAVGSLIASAFGIRASFQASCVFAFFAILLLLRIRTSQ